MKYLKYLFSILLCFCLFSFNSFSQAKVIKGKLAKSVFEFVMDSVLIKYDGVNPNSPTPNFIESKMGFCCYDSTCKKSILFEVSKIDSKESKGILEKISFESKLGRHMIRNRSFLLIDSCPPNRLYTVLGKKICSTISFSTPVFFAKNEYCLISYILFRAGEATIILKKQNKKWIVYKRMCESYN